MTNEQRADIRRRAAEQAELVRNNPKLRDLSSIFHSKIQDASRENPENEGLSEAEHELKQVLAAIPDVEKKVERIREQLEKLDSSASTLVRMRCENWLKRTNKTIAELQQRAKSLKAAVRQDKKASRKRVPVLDDPELRKKCEKLHVKI